MYNRGLKIVLMLFIVSATVLFVIYTRNNAIINNNKNNPDATTSPLPEVFSDLSYADGKTKSAENNQLLIIDFTAKWCGPCKKMDKTTWLDEDLLKWISENAIAIQIDIDDNKPLKTEFGISSIPVTLVMRNGVEIKRRLGYVDGPALLAWLQDL